jgi:hypothetical protein
MRSATPHTPRTHTRGRLTAALAACPLLGGAALLSAIATAASSETPGPSSTALQAALRHTSGTTWPLGGRQSTSRQSRCWSRSPEPRRPSTWQSALACNVGRERRRDT